MARLCRMNRPPLLLVLVLLACGPQGFGDPSPTALARYASAVVVATVVEHAVALQPELVPVTRRPLEPDGTGLGPDASLPIVGTFVLIRIDEVLKPDGLLDVGRQVDVFVAGGGFDTSGQWHGTVGQQYVLYLQLPLYGAEQRRSSAVTVQRQRLLPHPPDVVAIQLEHVYRVVASSAGGAAPASTVRLATLRDAIRAAIRPSVAITKPQPDATLTGYVMFAVDAHDDAGVASVQFLIDGVATGPVLRKRPFEYRWFSKSLPNGHHNVAAVARDGHGNESSAPPVGFTTANTNVGPNLSGGTTWDASGWNCRSANAVKHDPDGDPLVCHWHVGNSAAGECRPNCGGCGPDDATCAGSNDPSVPQDSCTISITCTDPWGASDSETWTLNRF